MKAGEKSPAFFMRRTVTGHRFHVSASILSKQTALTDLDAQSQIQ